jgi:hypothetical protein
MRIRRTLFGIPFAASVSRPSSRSLGSRGRAVLLFSALCVAGVLSSCGREGLDPGLDDDDGDAIKAAGALSVAASATPTSVASGGEVTLAVTVTTTRSTIVDVIVEIQNPAGALAYSTQMRGRGITASSPIQMQDTLTIEPTDAAGNYILGVTVRHTATGKVLVDNTNAARFTVGQSPGPGPAPVGACSGTAVFCDDFTDPALAGSYTLQRGTWTRASGTYTVTDTVVWERARALLAGDYTDFDVTLTGRSLGDAGFGLSYATQSIDDGFAVIVHPAQFQGVYLKELRPGQQDVNMKSYALPAQAAGQSMSLRVRRVGTAVTVWLDGTQVLTGDDGGTGRHGKLGLVLSVTDQTSGSGTEFSLLRLDSATPWSNTCTPQCSGKQCGSDGCGGSCGTCGSGASCDASGQCVSCTPQCSGKQCGPDGCGGSCGDCTSDNTCDASGQCVSTPGGGTSSDAPMAYPTKAVAIYNMMWSTSGSPKLSLLPANANVVNLAFAQGNPPTLVGWASQGEASFIADAKALRAQGVRVVVSVGGAGGSVNVGNRQAFVDSIMAINAKLPLDGLDWDIEGGSMNQSDVVWISTELKRQRGSGFAITMAPNGSNVDAYINVAVALNNAGALDMIGQQFYDAVVSYDAALGRINQMINAGIPENKVGIGMMVGDAATYWTVDECVAAVNYLKGRHPNLRGGYLWEHGRAGTQDWADRVGSLLLR